MVHQQRSDFFTFQFCGVLWLFFTFKRLAHERQRVCSCVYFWNIWFTENGAQTQHNCTALSNKVISRVCNAWWFWPGLCLSPWRAGGGAIHFQIVNQSLHPPGVGVCRTESLFSRHFQGKKALENFTAPAAPSHVFFPFWQTPPGQGGGGQPKSQSVTFKKVSQ